MHTQTLHLLLFPRVREQMGHTGFSHLLEDIYRLFHKVQYTTGHLSKNVPLVKHDYLRLAVEYNGVHILNTDVKLCEYHRFEVTLIVTTQGS